MSSEWQKTLIRYCCDINPSNIKANWPSQYIKYIDISSIGVGCQQEVFKSFLRVEAPSRAQRLIASGDCIISTVRPNRRSMIWIKNADDNLVASTGFAVLRAKPGVILPRFLYYNLFSQSFTDYLVTREKGAAYPAVSTTDIGDAEIYLPPLPEQQTIVDLLGSLDDRITLLRETNATLESIAQAIFKSWFIDFDPVKAKQQGEEPQGMDAATAALFPDAFQDSELGPIPAGWKWSTVGESFVLTMGQSPPGESYNLNGKGLPFYQGRSDFGFRFPSRRVFCMSPNRIAEAGDTMVSVRAPVGDVNRAIEKCCLGRGVAGVRHQTENQSFAFYVMKNLRQDFDHYNGVGTVFGAINKKDFNALTVIKPVKEVVNIFEDIVSSFDEQIAKNEKQSQTLASIRDALLPRLISGKLRLPEAEAMAGEAER